MRIGEEDGALMAEPLTPHRVYAAARRCTPDNRDSDTIDVGTVTNAGFAAMHNFSYDHNSSLDSNLQYVHEKLRKMEEYQTEENEYSGGMRR